MATPAFNDDTAMKTWRSLVRTTKIVGHLLRRTLQEHELSGPQFGVLRVVGEAGKAGIKLSDIGDRLLVTCGNVTGLVDRMEEAGLVKRVPHPDDRRALLAQLTEHGWKVYQELVPPHRERVKKILSCLTEEEQVLLQALMARVEENVDALSEEMEAAATPRG